MADKLIDKAVDLLQNTQDTPYKIAKSTGLSQTIIGQWKKGERKPSRANAKYILHYFGITNIECQTDNKEGGGTASSKIDIKRLAAEMRLKQQELGEIMGITQPQVSAIMQGNKPLLEVHEIRLKSHFGDIIDKYTIQQTGETQKDNTITNSTKTQEMDPLTMDYINTLKEQLAKVTAVVEEQNAIIKHLTQKGDDEVLSRRVGAIKEGQDELTENL